MLKVSKYRFKWLLTLMIALTLFLPYLVLYRLDEEQHLQQQRQTYSAKASVKMIYPEGAKQKLPNDESTVLPDVEGVEPDDDVNNADGDDNGHVSVDKASVYDNEVAVEHKHPESDDVLQLLPEKYRQRNFEGIEKAEKELEMALNEMYAATTGDILASLRLCVTVGIKTFNRPSCALNLIKSVLFYYPGISITVVNDGELPFEINETSWKIFDPSGGSNAEVFTNLEVIQERIDDVDSYLSTESPQLPIVLEDSSQTVVSTIRIINIPFDSGVSVGRNVLLHACRTKYILVSDDDYQFLPETDLGMMMSMLDFSEIKEETESLKSVFGNAKLPLDIVGGIRSEGVLARSSNFPRGSIFHLESMPIKNLSSNLLQYQHVYAKTNADGSESLNVLHIQPSWGDATKELLGLTTDVFEEDSLATLMYEGNCLPTDFIQQFFMARVESLKKGKFFWDGHLKNNDHYDFFLRATGTIPSESGGVSRERISILGCSAIRYSHAKTSKGACAADTTLKQGSYMDFRNRWVQYVPYLFQKWDVGLVIDDEIKKTIVISRDEKTPSTCHVLELRKVARLNKDYAFTC